MDALEGPSKISANNQVALPKRLMDELGWAKGDPVMFRISDDDPGVLRIVPEAVVLRQLRRGEDAERMMRMTSHMEPSRDDATPPE